MNILKIFYNSKNIKIKKGYRKFINLFQIISNLEARNFQKNINLNNKKYIANIEDLEKRKVNLFFIPSNTFIIKRKIYLFF